MGGHISVYFAVPPLVLLISAATAQQQQTIFTHGVASGEVSQTACILWTRAATNDTNVNLVLQVTTDPTFAVAPIQATHLRINASDDYTVKVAVSGLSPAVLYHYRFFVYNDSLGVATDISPAGQFKTAYDVNASSDVRFVYSGDADGARKPDGTPYYNSFETLQQAAKENPDFFIFDGDTIYGDSEVNLRYYNHEDFTTEDYWGSYKENREYQNLRELLQKTSTYVIWDDHEIYNDWTSTNFTGANFTRVNNARRSFLDYWTFASLTALEEGRVQGTYENNFTLSANITTGNITQGNFSTTANVSECYFPPLYRSFRWGKDVEVIILDERSCRRGNIPYVFEQCRISSANSENTLNSGPIVDFYPLAPMDVRHRLQEPLVRLADLLTPFFSELETINFDNLAEPPPGCVEALMAPNRTMLGPTQKEWFKQTLLNSTAKYKLVVSEVPIQQLLLYPYDRWEGYPVERTEILSFIRDNNITNVIFLTADIHMNLINPVFVDAFSDANTNDPNTQAPAFEIIVGPIATQSPLGIVRFHAGDTGAFLLQEPLEQYSEDILNEVHPAYCINIDEYSYAAAEYSAASGELTIAIKDGNGKVIEDQEDHDIRCRVTFPQRNLIRPHQSASQRHSSETPFSVDAGAGAGDESMAAAAAATATSPFISKFAAAVFFLVSVSLAYLFLKL